MVRMLAMKSSVCDAETVLSVAVGLAELFMASAPLKAGGYSTAIGDSELLTRQKASVCSLAKGLCRAGDVITIRYIDVCEV